LASTFAVGYTALRRRGIEPGQQRVVAGEWAALLRVGVVAEPTALEPACDPRSGVGENGEHFLVRGRGQWQEFDRAHLVVDGIEAVENERVKMDVQIDGAAGALHERDRAWL
jgi:hypothetical protein